MIPFFCKLQLLTVIGLGVATLTPVVLVNVLHHVSVLVAVLVTVLTLLSLLVVSVAVSDPSICSKVWAVLVVILSVVPLSLEGSYMLAVEVDADVVPEDLVLVVEMDVVSG